MATLATTRVNPSHCNTTSFNLSAFPLPLPSFAETSQIRTPWGQSIHILLWMNLPQCWEGKMLQQSLKPSDIDRQYPNLPTEGISWVGIKSCPCSAHPAQRPQNQWLTKKYFLPKHQKPKQPFFKSRTETKPEYLAGKVFFWRKQIILAKIDCFSQRFLLSHVILD